MFTVTPQGRILSPLLANVVLNELDWWIDSQWDGFPTKREYSSLLSKTQSIRKYSNLKEIKIVRYADDFKNMCKDYHTAQKIFTATKQWLKECLNLDISPEKSRVTNLRKNYSDFLGFKLKVKKGKANRYTNRSRMCDKAKKNVVDKLKSNIKKVVANPTVDNVNKYNSVFVGFHIRQTKQREEMYKELEKYSREVTKVNDEMAMFRHDYMNILYSLHTAINDKDLESVEMIYNDTIAPTVKIINVQNYEITKLEKICISELKSMLFVKFNIAKNQDIDVSFKVNGILEKASISKIILLRIFSIFLDNAIAGAKNSKEKQLKITFDEEKNDWIFKISNTIHDKVDIDRIFDKDFTTKSDEFANNSGLGLHYVKKVIE